MLAPIQKYRQLNLSKNAMLIGIKDISNAKIIEKMYLGILGSLINLHFSPVLYRFQLDCFS